jgi:hypothetical protein
VSFPKTNLHYCCWIHLLSEVRLICVCFWLQYRWLGTFFISIFEGSVWNMMRGSFCFLFFCPPHWCNMRDFRHSNYIFCSAFEPIEVSLFGMLILRISFRVFYLFFLCAHITLFMLLFFIISVLFRALFKH